MKMEAVVRRKLVVETEPTPPVPGSPTKLTLRIDDEQGKTVKQFDVLHEKLVHLIVVRDGLDEFAHLHPDVDASGKFTTEFTFPKGGKYRLFVDHQPKGSSPGLAAGELTVSGDDPPAPRLATATSNEVTIDMVKARIDVEPAEHETKVRFRLADSDGQVITDLQPYLGAMGHLVVISEDGQDYVHAHPLSTSESAPEGIVEFAAHFPKSGIYKAWGQFQRNGSVFTVPYVITHDATQPTSHSGKH